MSDAALRWQLAVDAASALATAPQMMAGVVLRARAGPVRDAWLKLLSQLSDLPERRLPPSVSSDRLHGGLDLAATLKAGRPVSSVGVLEEAAGGLLVVPMAECMEAGRAAELGAALDRAAAPILVLLDEGVEADERAPAGLADRLALHLTLEDIAIGDLSHDAVTRETIVLAQEILANAGAQTVALETLTRLAAAMGISSMRAPAQALRVARVLAALDGEAAPLETHIARAAALALVPRATVIPEPADESAPRDEPPEQAPSEPPEAQSEETTGALEDRVLEAAAALLPSLAFADPARARGGQVSSGAGARQRTTARGRVVGTYAAKPEAGRRLDVYATLRTAAPWQNLRRRSRPAAGGVIVEPGDFRVRRFERPSESVMIFLVDASGSAAASRMAEAKGAVELMLAEAYRRREKVALISFRGARAELLLPPTRSLLQAKRRLAVLPGGGGTPLASALITGAELARQVRRRGAAPFVVMLTDGRGNIALSGEPGRAQAAEDQKMAARVLAAEGAVSILIDTANRPQAAAAALAREMAARYLPLPRADAAGISKAVRASTAP